MEIGSELFALKIKLEGENFHASVPADYAHALWKLQQSFYKRAATVLYQDPSTVLTQEEKEKFLLVFSIEKGSTDSVASLLASFLTLAESMVEKMEPWQILLFAGLLCSTYLGGKGIDKYSSYKEKKMESDAEAERKAVDAKTTEKLLETQERITSDALQLAKDLLAEHHEEFVAAQEAGRDGRTAILKGVRGITRAEIGERTYTAEEIAEIKRRSPRTKATTEVRYINVAVVKVDTEDKGHPKLTLQEKNTGLQYAAEISSQLYEDEEDYENAMSVIWNSARYPNRFFWAEASMIFRKDRLVECSILAVGRNEEELKYTEKSRVRKKDLNRFHFFTSAKLKFIYNP